jgi:hypothetical protein
MNESFAAVDGDEQYTGNRFRLYSKSHFKDYVARASFACAEYPGPTQHVEVVCENHIINVIAAMAPVVQRLSSRPPSRELTHRPAQGSFDRRRGGRNTALP